MRGWFQRIVEYNSRLGVIIVNVVRLCLFCPWLTFVLSTEVAHVSLDLFYPRQKISHNLDIIPKAGNTHMVSLCHILAWMLYIESRTEYTCERYIRA